MGSFLVVLVSKRVEVLLQLDAVFDVVSVQSFVLECAAVALHDAVRVGALASGSDVLEDVVAGDHFRECAALVARAVVADDAQWMPFVEDVIVVVAVEHERPSGLAGSLA